MNKTSIVTTLPCGCVEQRWAFGRRLLKACLAHLLKPRPEPPGYWSSQTGPKERKRPANAIYPLHPRGYPDYAGKDIGARQLLRGDPHE